MKYLKLFNESIDTYKEKIIEFCNDHLAYLIDIGFKIEVVDFYDSLYGVVYEINIHKEDSRGATKYDWVDVNDDIIPFLTMLDTKYHIIKTEITYLDLKNWSDIERELSIEEIEKDEIDIENINSIFIDIAKNF